MPIFRTLAGCAYADVLRSNANNSIFLLTIGLLSIGTYQELGPSFILWKRRGGEAARTRFFRHLPDRNVERGAVWEPVVRLVVGRRVGWVAGRRLDDQQQPRRNRGNRRDNHIV